MEEYEKPVMEILDTENEVIQTSETCTTVTTEIPA